MRNDLTTNKPATISDVAIAAGVTKATVSYALSGKRQVTPRTLELVLQAARELGYSPNLHAQNLSNGLASKTISLFTVRLDTPQSLQKARKIQDLLRAAGYDCALHGYGDYNEFNPVDQTTLINTLRRQRPRAILCEINGLEKETLEEMARYREEGGIVVAYDSGTELPCDQVIFDRESNTYQAVRHLTELGHRHIGLFVPAPVPLSTGNCVRVKGLAKALAEVGEKLRPEWIFSGYTLEEGGIRLAVKFLKLPVAQRPTAMAIVNDYAAIAFMLELERAGVRVPRDLSVVGHDDSPMSRIFSVPLTTMSHPVTEVAQAVTDLLLARLKEPGINSPAPWRSVTIQGQLHVRSSAQLIKH